MSAGKQFSFVVFGATGFVGKYMIEYLAQISDQLIDTKWAIAGRCVVKLKRVLVSVSAITGKDMTDITIIQADVESQKSLENMAARSHLVINCVGPFEFFGEPVIRACIKEGSHHVDISREPKFLERMQLLYNEKAKRANVFILGAAGFDSLTGSTGIEFMRNNFKGDLNSVEAFCSINRGPKGSVLHFGTFQSAIHGLWVFNELKSIRAKLFDKPMPESVHKLPFRGILFKEEDLKMWCLPFPVTDKAIVDRTNYFKYHTENQRPFQFRSYLIVPGVFQAIILLIALLLFAIITYFSIGRRFLESIPFIVTLGFISKTGPTREQVAGTSFDQYLIGKGYKSKLSEPTDNHSEPPDQKIIVRVSGPEPAYVATSIFVIQVALTILKERSCMPKETGVLTPGSALSNTSLISNLRKQGIEYSIISNTLE